MGSLMDRFTLQELSLIDLYCYFVNEKRRHKYKNDEENINVEFSIYNEKFRHIIIKDHTRKFVLPFYITCLLCILKTFYYTLPILSKSFYADGKKWILNTLYSPEVNTQFIVLDEQ
jgi:hypothetical protein